MRNTVAKIKIEFNLPVSIFKEGKYFVAYTPALDLSTSAESYNGVQKRFSEAVEIFFEETAKKGTLKEALSSLGWRKIKKQWTPPLVVSHQYEKVEIAASRAY